MVPEFNLLTHPKTSPACCIASDQEIPNHAFMSEIENLFETLDYKPDSISSKTLIEKAGGSLTLYAFDKAQGLGEHTSPHITIVQLVEGKAEIRIDGQNSLIKDGDFVTIPIDVPYSLQAIHQVKVLIYRVNSSTS